MRIPRYMLKQSVQVRPYEGRTAYGPQYGTPYTLACRIEPRNELIRDARGNEVVASAKMYCGPNANLRPESVVVWDGTEYDVMSVLPEAGPHGKTHHVEVMLR